MATTAGWWRRAGEGVGDIARPGLEPGPIAGRHTEHFGEIGADRGPGRRAASAKQIGLEVRRAVLFMTASTLMFGTTPVGSA